MTTKDDLSGYSDDHQRRTLDRILDDIERLEPRNRDDDGDQLIFNERPPRWGEPD